MKSFEIAPKAGVGAMAQAFGSGCGCKAGGSDAGDSTTVRRDVMGRPLRAWEIIPQSNTRLWRASIRVRSADPGPSPGANLCDALAREVQRLREEIEQLGDRYGRHWREVQNAWEDARRVCEARDQEQLCTALGDAWTRSPVAGPGLLYRNQLWLIWNACTRGAITQGSPTQNIACILARQAAVALESRVRRELGDYDLWYERDIAPRVGRLLAAERRLSECEHPTATSPWPAPPDCGAGCKDNSNCNDCCSLHCGRFNHAEIDICRRRECRGGRW